VVNFPAAPVRAVRRVLDEQGTEAPPGTLTPTENPWPIRSQKLIFKEQNVQLSILTRRGDPGSPIIVEID
jgi:hypothetical protein